MRDQNYGRQPQQTINEVTFWHNGESSPITSLSSGQANIICDPELLQTQWLLNHLQKNFTYSRMLSSNNLEVIVELTAQGCGVGILPAVVAKRHPKLKPIPNTPSYSDEICLVYRPENKKIMAIQEIILAIKKHFGKA